MRGAVVPRRCAGTGHTASGPALLGAGLLAACLLAGCGASAGGAPVVSRTDLEQEVATRLEQQVGQAPDDVACPGDLVGEVGEVARCTLTAGSDRLGVTVTVTAVKGDDVRFDIQVDDQPR